MRTEYNEKQVRILQVAEKLFADKGFAGTSVRDISKEAGVNIAMISYYFGSKERMMEALILYRMADLKIQLRTIANEDADPLVKIDKIIDLYVRRICRNREIHKILYFEFNDKQRASGFEVLSEVKKHNLAFVRQIIAEGQQKGVFSTNVNADLIPTTIVGTAFHFNLNNAFYMELLGLKTMDEFETYLSQALVPHIQQTIKALLLYEK
jgi:AcrR family transcriptional regulator